MKGFLHSLVVVFAVVASVASQSREAWKPSEDESYVDLITSLLSNPTEEFKAGLDKIMEEVGLKGWSNILLQNEQGDSNEGYEAVVDALITYDGIIDSIPPAIKNLTADCQICLGTVFGLKFAIKKWNETFVLSKMVSLCELSLKPFGVRVDPFCQGMVDVYSPHAVKIVDKNPLFLKSFCPFVNACLPPRPEASLVEETFSDDVAMAPIEKSPETIDSSEVFTIAQFTDIHLEERYGEATDTACGLPVCCLPKWGKGTAGKWGDYRCNVPPQTFESFLIKAKSLKPDLVLFTGDVAPHTVWEESLETQLQATTATAQLFKKHFDTVLPAIGNHETFPTNLFSIKETKETNRFLDHFIASWKGLASFSKGDEKNIRNGGFYNREVAPGLRVITFNSAYMYTFNFYNIFNHKSTIGKTEAKDTYDFIRKSLQEAKKKKEKVILAFHHPMGTFDFIVSESIWLEKVLLEYKDTVVLVVNGHTHYNEFRVLYDQAKKPSVVTFAAPSLSSNKQRNPSIRLYHLNKKSFALVDYQQYSLNISQVANVDTEDVSSHIHESYSAKAEYQLPDLSAASWHSLINRMNDDDNLLFKHMSNFENGAFDADQVSPRKKRNHLCRLKNVHFDLYKACSNFTLPTFTLPPSLPTLPPNFPTLPDGIFNRTRKPFGLE